ncbi:MAG: hypothetical protein ABJP45_11210 [Cyclobacteriaceae bacterium]
MHPVLFIHIPKTAGTTLNHILSHQYGWRFMWLRSDIYQNEVSRILPADIYWAMSAHQKKHYSAYAGHQTSELIPELPYSRKIMLCRNPLDQIPSYYAHHRRHFSDSPSNLTIRKHEKLKDFLSSRSDFYPNPQVKNLFGNQIVELSNEEIEQKIEKLVSKHIDYCAPTDRFHDFVLVLAEKLNWRKNTSYKSLNASPSTIKINDKERRIIEDSNLLDFYLYNEVCRKFEILFAEHKIDFDTTVSINSSKNLIQFKVRNRIQQLITSHQTGFSLRRK